MKNQFMALTLSAVMATQGILVNFAAAQTVENEVCGLAGNLKTRLGSEIAEEQTRIQEAKEVIAQIDKSVAKDEFKDNVKDGWRIFAIATALLSYFVTKDKGAAVKDVLGAAGSAAAYKMEDVFDMKELKRVNESLKGAVQRREMEISMLNQAVGEISSKDCNSQASEMSSILQTITARRINELKIMISNLESLKKQAPTVDGWDKTLEYAKRPSTWTGSVLTLVGAAFLLMSANYPLKSIVTNLFVRLPGVIALAGGGWTLYTTHLEAQRAIKNKMIEIDTIQAELSTRVKQLEAVQTEIANMKKILG